MYNKTIRIFTVFLMLLFLFVEVMAEGNVNKKPNRLSKTNGVPSKTHFNINNISTWIFDNGDSDISPTGNSGFIFPKGSNKAAVFESGFLWGAKVNGQVRVGGSTYNQGLLPGRILANGQREDDALPGVRIYRVRKDWETGNLSAEVNDGEGTEAEIRAQYEKDWNEWPAAWGAPYEDVDGNGSYDPNVDIPGVPGADQTIWYVANDLDPATTQQLYGSDPMGIEYQATFWGYASQTALGNTMFRKYKLINKSSDTFEDMYVSMWSDEDLGDAGDDFAGCDVDLSLMFVYNGVAIDPVYGATPPAVGFDFFQGPIVPGDPTDQAIFNNKFRTGFKNLPMTAHYFFINSDAVFSDPDLGDYANGTLQFYNLFQGLISTTGQPFTDPNTGEATKFALAGDPITGKGWVDGQLHPPGDRRQGMASGPFTMAPGDTQEVVVAELAAGNFGNVDRLSAVGLLKFFDQEAQNAYDNFFKIPSSPDAPKVTASELDGKVVLLWDQDRESVKKIESHNDGSYSFQGYVVYQFPSKSASFQDAKVVATFDKDDGVGKVIGPAFDSDAGVVLPQVLKFGSDSGIKRFITLDKDLFNAGAPLNDGTKYYYAVTSYSVSSNADAVPLVLESKVNIETVIPQSPAPGVREESEIGQVVTTTHVTGVSDGIVKVNVVDPAAVTGDDYQVNFENYEVYTDDGSGNIDTSLALGWTLFDVTTGKQVLGLQKNLSGVVNSYLVVDGLQVAVSGPEPGIKGDGDAMVEVAYGGTPLTEDQFDAAGAPYGGNKVWHSLSSASDTRYYFSASGSGSISRIMRYIDFAVPRDFELRFTDAGGLGVWAFEDDKIGTTPWELWDIGVATVDDPSDDVRMIPILLSQDSTKDAWGWANGTDNYFGFPASDIFYWMDPEGTDGYNKFVDVCNQSGGAGSTYDFQFDTSTEGYWMDFHGGFVYPWGRYIIADFSGNGAPPAGTTVRIITYKPLTADEQFTFTAPKVTKDLAAEKADVEKINVFPNPYYGVNPNEINKYQRFVTFNHLPNKAVIRVFNLAGQLVKTINKNSSDQFERWDLKNQNGLPAASGLYIVHIDMPDLGKTKILKVAIIQETQVLDRF